MIAVAAVVFALFMLRTDSVEERIKNNQMINILFTIHDGERLVFLETFFYNPETNKGAILFLPNETWLMLESLNRYDKIEKLYSPGNTGRLMEKLEKILDVKIPYSIDLNFEQCGDIVDLLGGIEIFIPNSVNFRVGDKLFAFESGSVVLDGDKARDYLLLELESDTDMERAQRRQDFLKALLESMIQAVDSEILLRAEPLAFLAGSMKANMSGQELETFIRELAKLNTENILYRRVHGTVRMQNDERIFIPNDQGEQLKQTMSAAMEFLRDSADIRPEDLIVNLEILNGTDIAFRARDTAKIYRKYGYEIVKEDNAPEKPVEKTVIIDHKGNTKIASEVAAVIKCKKIETKLDEKSLIDVTIIIGKDFDGQYCQ